MDTGLFHFSPGWVCFVVTVLSGSLIAEVCMEAEMIGWWTTGGDDSKCGNSVLLTLDMAMARNDALLPRNPWVP